MKLDEISMHFQRRSLKVLLKDIAYLNIPVGKNGENIPEQSKSTREVFINLNFSFQMIVQSNIQLKNSSLAKKYLKMKRTMSVTLWRMHCVLLESV